MHEWIQNLIEWYTQSLQTGGYPLIILLMAVESSIVPLPSELVIPPAAFLAYTHRVDMSVAGVIVAGAVGSWLGATVMYWVSRIAGRPLLFKYGDALLISPGRISRTELWLARFGGFGVLGSKMLAVVRHLIGILVISPEKIAKAERWSARFGGFGVFGSRMLPVIRHLIGIPSGIVRFPYLRYSLYTLAGSAIWCAVLAWVSVLAGNDPGLMSGDLKAITLWIAAAIAVLGALYYFFVHRYTREEA